MLAQIQSKNTFKRVIVSNNFFFSILVLLFSFQLFIIGKFPITDSTESRYANISLNMVLTNDWITPKFLNQRPYFGKPPFVFWVEALSYKIFGFNEFAPRFPSILASMLTLFFTFLIARTFFDRRAAILSLIITYTSIMFFIESNVVSIDIFVAMVTTGLIYFVRRKEVAIKNNESRSYIYDIGLGVLIGFALLIKGVAPIAYFIGPLFLFSVFTRSVKLLFVPNWFIACTVGIIVAAPWFIISEKLYPGFLKYFFINEHFLRYIKKDYGDLYTAGHDEPFGMSWIFTFISLSPWLLLVLPLGMCAKDKISKLNEKSKKNTVKAFLFLFSWTIFTPLFFSFAKSYLMAYFSAAIPPLAILLGRYLSKTLFYARYNQENFKKRHLIIFLLTNIGIIVALNIDIVHLKKYHIPYQMLVGQYLLIFVMMVLLLGFYLLKNLKIRLITLLLPIIFFTPIIIDLWFTKLLTNEFNSRSQKGLIVNLLRANKEYLTYPMVTHFGSIQDSVDFYKKLYVLKFHIKEKNEYDAQLVIVKDHQVKNFLRKNDLSKETKPVADYSDYKIYKIGLDKNSHA